MSNSKGCIPPGRPGPVQKHKRGQEPIPSLLNHYRGHKGSILSLAFHPNTQTLFSSSADGYIMNWNYGKESRALRFEGHCGAVNDVGISRYGDLMISASDDQTARIWVPIIKGEYIVVKGHSGAVRSAAFNPVDSTIFATGSNDKTIKVWSVQSAKNRCGATKFKSHNFISSFTKHTNWIRSVRFSGDGNLICSASDDKTIRVFDNRSNECTSTMTCDIGCPIKAEFNPCGNSFIGVCTTEKAFLLYDVRQNKLLQSYLDLAGASVNSFAFHPTGDFAVCVSDDAKIKILDLIEGRPIFTLYGPRTALYTTAFNASGSLFATGGKDKELLIWEPILLPYTPDETCCGDDKENGSSTASSGSGNSSSSTGSLKGKSIESLSRCSSSASSRSSKLTAKSSATLGSSTPSCQE